MRPAGERSWSCLPFTNTVGRLVHALVLRRALGLAAHEARVAVRSHARARTWSRSAPVIPACSPERDELVVGEEAGVLRRLVRVQEVVVLPELAGVGGAERGRRGPDRLRADEREVAEREADLLVGDELLDRRVGRLEERARTTGTGSRRTPPRGPAPTRRPRSRCRSARAGASASTTVAFSVFERELCMTMPTTAATTTTPMTIQTAGDGPRRARAGVLRRPRLRRGRGAAARAGAGSASDRAASSCWPWLGELLRSVVGGEAGRRGSTGCGVRARPRARARGRSRRGAARVA